MKSEQLLGHLRNSLQHWLIATTILLFGLWIGVARATPLTPNPDLDLQGPGLTLVASGVGLEGLGATESREISIFIGGPVQRAFLYWAGRDLSCPAEGEELCSVPFEPYLDQQLQLDGVLVNGTIIGQEAQGGNGSINNIGYAADVTAIVAAGGMGNSTFEISDADPSSNLSRLNGATLLVIYEDQSDPNSYRMIVFEGLDFAFEDDNPLAPAHVTDPINFNYAATGSSRTGQLVIVSGDTTANRPDRIDITDASGVTELVDLLVSADGESWDTLRRDINIPANGDTTTVQLFSEPVGQFPDSLLWEVGALRIPLPPTAELGDRVWEDRNVNGVQDCEDTNNNGILGDAGDTGPECDAGIPDVPVKLLAGDCSTPLGQTATTDMDGFYLFPKLEPGDYCVEFGKPPADFCDTDGFELGAPQFTAQNAGNDEAIDSDADTATGITDPVSLAAGETDLTVDAGIFCPAKLGDLVWFDDNENGLQDTGEEGVPDVTVKLFECTDGQAIIDNNKLVRTTTTTGGTVEDINYMFGAEPDFDLQPGEYFAQFIKPDNTEFTIHVDDPFLLNSDCMPPDGVSPCAVLGSRGINLNRDCGLIPPPPPECDIELDKKCRVETPPVSGDLECEAKIAASVLEYTGPGTPSVVSVTGKDKNSTVVSNFDTATGILTVDARPGDLGSKMTITTDGVAEVIHTSCSAPYVAGQPAPLDNPKGDPSANWLVLSFVDKNGGSASIPGDTDGMFTDNCTFTPGPAPSCATLKADNEKLSSLTFQYTGGGCPGDNDQGDKSSCSGSIDPTEGVTVQAGEKVDKLIYPVQPMFVAPDGEFTVDPDEFKGESALVAGNAGGTETNEFHTSCSQPLAVGDVFGSFTLVAMNGQSGSVDVTYQYVVTNNGDPVSDIFVTDNPLGPIGGPISLGTGESSDPLTKTVRIQGTTVNTGTASGTLDDGSACQASDSVVVEAVIPPCVVTPGEFKLEDDKIKWKLTNDGDKVATVESIEFSAPDEFGAVKKVKLDGDIFKDDTRPMTWTFTDADFTNDLKNRQIKVGDTKELQFETTEKFKTATADQISITVNFKEGCSVTFVPGAQAFVCKDAKPIDSLSMLWNGAVPVTVSAAGQVANVTVPGQEVTFSGLSGMGNDVEWSISGAVSGISTFHVSCSDQAMNGPEDCGSAQGNGKGDDKGLNLWLFEGMAGSNGIGFDCSALP